MYHNYSVTQREKMSLKSKINSIIEDLKLFWYMDGQNIFIVGLLHIGFLFCLHKTTTSLVQPANIGVCD